MNNPERPKVNQRLYFATLHLQTMQRLIDEQRLPRQVVEQALGESVLMHLVMAYRAYLRELAVAYAIDNSPLESAVELQQALASKGKHSAECEELLAQEATGEWLAALLSAFFALGSDLPTDNAAIPRDGGLRFHSLSENSLNITALQAFYDQLHSIIESQRTRLEEW